MNRPIVLLSDFGTRDAYLGQMKGQIALYAPNVQIIDLCHEIEPFNILQAAFYLFTSAPFFPRRSVFISVVDPGVGGERRILLAICDGQYHLVPDNGLISILTDNAADPEIYDLTHMIADPDCRVFHGRDIFPQLGAKLALGEEFRDKTKMVHPEAIVRLPSIRPELSDKEIKTIVGHIDRFGNCLLALKIKTWQERYAGKKPYLLQPLCCELHPAETYSRLPASEAGLISGSQGFMEISMFMDNASRRLGLKAGDRITIGV